MYWSCRDLPGINSTLRELQNTSSYQTFTHTHTRTSNTLQTPCKGGLLEPTLRYVLRVTCKMWNGKGYEVEDTVNGPHGLSIVIDSAGIKILVWGCSANMWEGPVTDFPGFIQLFGHRNEERARNNEQKLCLTNLLTKRKKTRTGCWSNSRFEIFTRKLWPNRLLLTNTNNVCYMGSLHSECWRILIITKKNVRWWKQQWCRRVVSTVKARRPGDIIVAATCKHNHMLPNMYTKSQCYRKNTPRLVGLPPAFSLQLEIAPLGNCRIYHLTRHSLIHILALQYTPNPL